MHTEFIEPASEPYSGGPPGSAQISKSSNRGFDGLGDRNSMAIYQPGAVLYREGQKCAGIFRIEHGKVKLSISSSSGRTAIMKIVQPGELMGIMESFVNCPYLATAEVIEQSHILFIARTHLQGVWSQGGLKSQIVTQLSRECSRTFRELGAYRLSSSASQRLVHLLLELLEDGTRARHKRLVKMPYTHSEIGQLIGCSRETVTRLLKHFRESRLIEVDRSTIHIEQIEKLREIAQL